jgi:hypothetical protein
MKPRPALTHGELLQLRRWNAPTIYHDWGQITRHEAATFMDANACHTLIAAARGLDGLSTHEILTCMDQARRAFAATTRKRFGNGGEW